MEVTKLLMMNYLPYAKGTIINRAIPQIDGLKPSQRRVLYTMHEMGLDKESTIRAKSSRIAGQVLKYHPHGDDAVYDTMVRMSVDHEAMNVPYIDSKGNFGKVYSSSLQYANKRYTEAKLTKVASEFFKGIDENAVDFVPNFDNSDTEPVILPVSFPNILVNANKGIAVGTSSNIPCFSLKNVCNATKGILKGEITDCEQLADVLGVPEFTTGGFVHADKNSLVELAKTGYGTFTISGAVNTYTDRIIIYEIPYNTTCDDIEDAIRERAKSGELKEVSNVKNETDINGFKMTVHLKRGSNVHAVLNKLCRLTPLRNNITFKTRVIIDNKCKELGILDLLHEWIIFRRTTIRRILTYNINKKKDRRHKLSAWEKIYNRIPEVLKFLSEHKYDESREWLAKVFNMDDIQVDVIMDTKISNVTVDKAIKALSEIKEIDDEIKTLDFIINNDSEIDKKIIEDLDRIVKIYGTENKTQQADIIVPEPVVREEDLISDEPVMVAITKKFLIKRFTTIKEMSNYSVPAGDAELMRFNIKNNDHLLVFTTSGAVHKLLVNDIDASRGGFKENIATKLGLLDTSQIIWIDAAGDYSGYFNLIYPNGKGVRVFYNRASGKRAKYIGLYKECEPGNYWVTRSNKFFMITQKRKASYCDLSNLGIISARSAFKIARVNSGDRIYGLQPLERVPNINNIDIQRYCRDYTVNIGEDQLW